MQPGIDVYWKVLIELSIVAHLFLAQTASDVQLRGSVARQQSVRQQTLRCDWHDGEAVVKVPSQRIVPPQ